MNLAESNIKEIIFRKSNYFSYKNITKISSLNFFINLNDSNINNDDDLHLNYKLIQNEIYPTVNLKISLVDKYYILNKKMGTNSSPSKLNLTIYPQNIHYNNITGNGYALFNLSKTKNYLNEEDKFLFITLESNFADGLDFIISLTDFKDNYPIPMNQYLFMNIKNSTQLNITKKYINNNNNHEFLEASLDSSLNINIPGQEKIINKFGKIYYNLDKDKNYYTLDIELKPDSQEAYIFFRYGFSSHEDFSYFKLTNEEIKYNDTNTSISFGPLSLTNEKDNKNNEASLSAIYTIQIFKKKSDDMQKIIGIYEPLSTMRATKIFDNIISENINSFFEPRGGIYYLNVYAEARIEKENIHEYLVYNTLEITHIGGIITENITIDQDEKHTEIFYNTGANITATISLDDPDIMNLTQYKFIKLILDNTDNNTPRKRKEIYASVNKSIFDSNRLYNESEYKASGKDDKVILTVPLNKLEENKKFKELYIVIPCYGKACNLTLTYKYEDGRSQKGISIEYDACYDLLLQKIEDSKNSYRFINFDTERYPYPLITFTSNSANDFKLLIIGSEDNYLHKNFMNGQSFLFKYDDNPYDFHHFVLITNETMTFHICHRSIKETKSNDEIKYKKFR